MAKAKKGTQKAAKAVTTNGAELSAQVLEKALHELEAGVVGIKEAGIALGFTSGAPLRKALREMVGTDRYQAVIDSGRSVRGVAAIGTPSEKAPTKRAPVKNKSA